MFYQKKYIEAQHGESIYSDSQVAQSKESELIETVFGHHPACFDPKEPAVSSKCLPIEDDSVLKKFTLYFKNRFFKSHDGSLDLTSIANDKDNSIELPHARWLSWNFYNNHYVRTSVKKGVNGKVELEQGDFVNHIARTRSHSNSVYFLQGDIGSGKTTYLNSLITCHGARLFKEENIWFLRLNVELLRQNDAPLSQKYILENLIEKLIKIIRKFSNEQRSTLEITVPDRAFSRQIKKLKKLKMTDDITVYRMVFFEVTRKISQLLGKRFLLIVDNLDAYFHQVDRYLFTDKNFSSDDQHIESVHNLIKEFHHGAGVMGDLNAILLFVVRFDSYASLIHSSDIFKSSEDFFSNNKNLFSLYEPKWQSVVTERRQLVMRYLNTLEDGEDKELFSGKIVDLLASISEPELMKSSIAQLKKLARYGLRDILEHVKTSIWAPELGKDNLSSQTSRSIDDVHIGLLTFMLNHRRLFSQRHSAFPNIYYVGIEEEEKNNLRKRLGQDVCMSHKHTYFLKLLLLKFINYRNLKNIKTTTEDIVKAFCGTSSDSSYSANDGYFYEILVRECLGALAQTNQSYLIKIERGIGLTPERLVITNIELTSRGKYFLEEIYCKFVYLQIVIDDFDLRFLNIDDQYHVIDESINYSYLVQTGDDYYSTQRLLLGCKAEDVIRFLAMLDAHADEEKRIYAKSLEKLKKLDSSIAITDVTRMTDFVLTELERLKVSGAAKTINTTQLRKQYKKYLIEYRKTLGIVDEYSA